MIPPFPSQDLAKLVLGYLAEEQLMTAYDEFLQASPYLDVLRNEYDRIFMTSLKNILAEYRAVKIYVETCKPLSLRKKLFQCSNLLEVVKFLIHHIDINKIDITDKPRIYIQNVNTTKGCELCTSLKLVSCVCKGKLSTTQDQPTNQINTPNLEGSVETTSLADLPGNHVTTKKSYVKLIENNCSNTSKSSSFYGQNSMSSSKQFLNLPIDTNIEQNVIGDGSHNSQMKSNQSDGINLTVKTADILESSQKIEEFNDILNIVCNNSSRNDSSSYEIVENKKKSTFQDFANGVNGGEKPNVIVPDSSTSENTQIQLLSREEINLHDKSFSGNIKGTINTMYLSNNMHSESNSGSQSKIMTANLLHSDPDFKSTCLLRSKPDDHKITILSDIKVENLCNTAGQLNNTHVKTPPVLNNATSTPLLQMQSNVNGTPAYKSNPQIGQRINFTKDEIMAMPTIILVPTSGSSQNPLATRSQAKFLQSTNVTSSINTGIVTTISSSTAPRLGPLTIDISSDSFSLSNRTNINNANMITYNEKKIEAETCLVKTVDISKNASAPKDTIPLSSESSTPLVNPPTRKSSSTPRRTSHVRVLDFTTPRRILHETINEHVSNQNFESPVEVVISGSSNEMFSNIADMENIDNHDIRKNVNTCNNVDIGSTKENNTANKVILGKKHNWDDELRALIPSNDSVKKCKNSSKSKSKTKSKASKKKTFCEKQLEVPSFENEKSLNKKLHVKKKMSSKGKSFKKKKNELDDFINEQDHVKIAKKIVDIPVKPTINIINGNDWTTTMVPDNTNRSKSEEQIETPEMDRLSLQNPISSKLNISDLLETPYKQVLYDIQMETPRFLGPDIPGEPMSDIKIMNIPTPRFLNTPNLAVTPKPMQATPSSHSSRPTDYSSGGSYYKPDDQDYMPEDIGCPVTSTFVNENPEITEIESSNKSIKESKKVNVTKSRPVRQCTKNVSYYNMTHPHTHSSNINNKIKNLGDKAEVEVVLNSGDLTSINSSIENKNNKDIDLNPSKNKSKVKAESTKKSIISKKLKSPTRRQKSKSFMKIKPRMSTPTKEMISEKNKTSESLQNGSVKLQTRRRTISKEKNNTVTPVVTLVPTKSRRKSSTPRKLHCTKTFNQENSNHDSREIVSKSKNDIFPKQKNSCVQDSDTEQLPLRWSDDGSQDTKPKENEIDSPYKDTDDILKIQQYIESTKPVRNIEGCLHIDLIKRGFDVETAKIIEHDLLDTPPCCDQSKSVYFKSFETAETKTDNALVERIKESVYTLQEADETVEIELSIHECNENSENYIITQHDDAKDLFKNEPTQLKDKFSMEVCIDDGVVIRLRATPFTLLLEQEPIEDKLDCDFKETELAVRSISTIDKLYTPMKNSMKAQCYEIFDSTLTSLDTPLKVNSPQIKDGKNTVAEIVLEVEQIVEKVEMKQKTETKKRKRLQSESTSDESLSDSKRAKPETQYLLNSANIQNIDIESVLSKLHGP